MSAVVVLHPIEENTLSVNTKFAQIAEVLCRPSECSLDLKRRRTNNPINLVADGKRQEFDTLRDFYLKVLQLLYHDYPRGYIDFKVFLYEHTMLRGTPPSECCKDIERGWEESEGFCIEVPWTYGIQAHEKLIVFLCKMSRHATGAFFDLRQFDAAWNIFIQSVNKE